MRIVRKVYKSVLLAMLILNAASAQAQTSVKVADYRDLVRFTMQRDVEQVRLKILGRAGEEIFDSGFNDGNTIDWRRCDRYRRSVEVGSYSYALTAKDKTGNVVEQERGSLIVDKVAELLIDAPPLAVVTGSPHVKAIRPAHAGTWDVDHGAEFYTINTPRMGLGTQNPLVRLHVGTGTVPAVTTGATLLVEDGVATSMVMKSTSGAEMFFYQDQNNGTFGTASAHPLGIRTNNLNRIWIESGGNVGIGTQFPGQRLTVAGTIESTSGGFRFPDGTVQTSAATGGGGSVVHGATLIGNGSGASPLNVAAPLFLNGTSPGAIIDGRNNGDGWGVYGRVLTGIGVFGEITSSSGAGTGVYGKGPDYGVAGLSTAGTPGFNAGVYGEGTGPGGTGVFGGGLAYGVAGVTRTEGGNGVYGEGLIGAVGTGVNGMGLTYGVLGNGGTHGVFGHGVIGVYGDSTATDGRGLIGVANNGANSFGVWGKSTNGFAGFFEGKVQVTGMLIKPAGSFMIDHPLDPENKYLYHSFVESPDMMNIYNGNAVLGENGEATVNLPEWFEALNKDFRYQLTCIGGFAQIYIAEEIANNSFKISGGRAGLKVSWQVTGIRKDPYAEKYRIKVEEDKPEQERGYYLHPEVYGQPEEKSTERARDPEMFQRMKQEGAKRPRLN